MRARRPRVIAAVALLAVVALLTACAAPTATSRSIESASLRASAGLTPDARGSIPRLAAGYARLPLSFEPNHGQTDASVRFLARGAGYTMFLTDTEAVLVLGKPSPGGDRRRDHAASRHPSDATRVTSQTADVVRMKLVGARAAADVAGLDPLPGRVNYFLGNDPAQWRTGVPTYARVRFRDVYPGVELVYYGRQRQLEYDLVVAPGADARAIRLAFEGVERLDLDSRGDLLLATASGSSFSTPPPSTRRSTARAWRSRRASRSWGIAARRAGAPSLSSRWASTSPPTTRSDRS